MQKNRVKRIKLRKEKADRFPDDEAWLLPTAFGNTIRAFEVYSRVMYGLDAIPGWERLLTVIPKDYRTLIDDAKAQTDFWINLWVLSLGLVFEYILISIYTYKIKFLWLPPLIILFAFIASHRARASAIEWGHYVKASFDIFLPDLYKKLGLQYPLNRKEEKQKLIHFSQAIIYRSEASLHDRTLTEAKR